MLILHRWTSHHSQYLVLTAKCFVSLHSDSAIGHQMQRFNQEKKFDQALQLFDEYKGNNPRQWSSTIVTQALKACIQIGDFKRGIGIHHRLPSSIKKDRYVSSSLIRLYSKIQLLSIENYCFPRIFSAIW